MENLRFALLQCRLADDPMREQEIESFRVALNSLNCQIRSVNILFEAPTSELFEQSDAIFVGGSGDFSVLQDLPFLPSFLDFLGKVCDIGFPMFASCFGFQAICLALGGTVVHDPPNAEVGTYRLYLTGEGKADPVFGQLPEEFNGQMGHKDRADKLPTEAIRLAYSDQVFAQAFKIKGKPIYATQFHPELSKTQNRERFESYLAEYSNDKVNMDVETIRNSFRESKETYSLLPKFVKKFLTNPAD